MLAARTLAIALVFAAAFMPVRQRASPQAFSPPPPLSFDVVVVGSTPAGIAAALAAAERGLRVAFLTRSAVLGGDLSQGMLTQWDLQHSLDGSLLEGDLFEQFYRALPSGFVPAVAARYFKKRIGSQTRITWFSRIHILKVLSSSDAPSRTLTGLELQYPQGTALRVDGRYFIDATRDGDLAAEAGARYDVGRQDQGIDTRISRLR